MKVWRNVSLESFSAGEPGGRKSILKNNRRTQKIHIGNTISSGLPNLKNIQMWKGHLKTNSYYHIAKENH